MMIVLMILILITLIVTNTSLRPTTTSSSTSSNRVNSKLYSDKKDYYDDYSIFDKILFNRFSNSVVIEMNTNSNSNTNTNSNSNIFEAPKTYKELINMINLMTISRPSLQVHDQAKNMLVRLFPPFILQQFPLLFARPFPRFSYWMNAWVTHYTTNWLMGNSTIIDIDLPDGTIGKEQGNVTLLLLLLLLLTVLLPLLPLLLLSLLLQLILLCLQILTPISRASNREMSLLRNSWMRADLY